MKLKFAVLLATAILALSACSSAQNGEAESKKEENVVQTSTETQETTHQIQMQIINLNNEIEIAAVY